MLRNGVQTVLSNAASREVRNRSADGRNKEHKVGKHYVDACIDQSICKYGRQKFKTCHAFAEGDDEVLRKARQQI